MSDAATSEPVSLDAGDSAKASNASGGLGSARPAASVAMTGPVGDSPAEESTLMNSSAPEVPGDMDSVPANPDVAWYVRSTTSDEQYGPADEATFMQWITEGRVTPDALIWRDGWADWQFAQDALPERFHALSATEAPTVANSVEFAAAPAEAVAPITDVGVTTSGLGAMSPAERTRMAKRQKKKKNYRIMLAVLLVLAVVLIVALGVVVLTPPAE